MNTAKSDAFVKEWKQKENPLKRESFTLQADFDTTPEKLFRLLCPTTEYDWIPIWECDLLHSRSGYSEYNTIFSTDSFGPLETFVCTRFEPNSMIEYVRTTKDVCMTMTVTIRGSGKGAATSQWSIILSALHEEGNQEVMRILKVQDDLPDVFHLLEDYIATGA